MSQVENKVFNGVRGVIVHLGEFSARRQIFTEGIFRLGATVSVFFIIISIT